MEIKMSDGGTWATAARKAHALSQCNKDVTFFVRYNRVFQTWYILTRLPSNIHNSWDINEGYSDHRNGQRKG